MKRVRALIWHGLPAWCNVYMIAQILFVALFFEGGPFYFALLTAIIPSGPALYYIFTLRRNGPKGLKSSDIDTWMDASPDALPPDQLRELTNATEGPATRWFALTVLLAPVLAWIAYSFVFGKTGPLSQDRALLVFEISSALWAILLFLHCLFQRGAQQAVIFFLGAGLYAFLLETGGIEMGFFSEASFHVFFPFSHTPLAVVSGWCTVFYPAFFLGEFLAHRWRATQVSLFPIIVGLVALASDLHLDPVATALQFWTWHADLPARFLDVPVVNFTSWFWAVFAFGAGFLTIIRIGTRMQWKRSTSTLVFLVSIPAIQGMAGFCNFLCIGLIEGFDGPSWKLLLLSIASYVP